MDFCQSNIRSLGSALRSSASRLVVCCILLALAASRLEAQSDPVFVRDSLVWDSIGQLMEAAFNAGNYLEAARLAEEANNFAQAHFPPSHLLVGQSLDNLGTTLHHAGKLREARPALEAAQQHAATYLGPRHEDYLTRLNNLAMLYKDLQEYNLSMAAFEELLGTGAEVFGKDDPMYGIFLNNAGILCEQTGRLDQAAVYYRQSLDITARSLGKKHPKYATRLFNLAVLQRRNGHFEEALGLLQEALTINETNYGKSHPNYFSCLGEIGVVYYNLGQYDLADQYLAETLQRIDSLLGKTHVLYATYLFSLANVKKTSGHPEQAIEMWEEMAALRESLYGIYAPQGWVEHRELAETYAQLGQLEPSARHLSFASDHGAEFIRLNFGQMGEAEQRGLAQQLYPLVELADQLAWQYPQDTVFSSIAFNNLLLSKNLLFENRRSMMQSLRDISDPEVRREFAEWEDLQTLLGAQYARPSAKRRPDIDSLQQRATTLENRLARHSDAFRDARRIVHWQDVQAALKPGEAALEISGFTWHDSLRLVGFFIDKNSAQPHVIDFGPAAAFPKPAALRKAYGYSEQPTDNLQWLVGKALLPNLAHISRMYLSPYGLFNLINMSAIPVGPEQVFSDRLQIVRVGSTRDLVSGRLLDSAPGARTARVFGGIDYDRASATARAAATERPDFQARLAPAAESGFRNGATDQPWIYLPATLDEAREVERFLKSRQFEVVRLSDSSATEASFKQMGRQEASPCVIHLATHGFFFPEPLSNAGVGFVDAQNPLIRSGMVLAGANRVWIGKETLPGEDDGILTADEIARMDLSHTELVVLSACGTGLGELSSEEGVYGLQRAFRIAGAHYVLMTLWSVDDRSTQLFMREFYRQWQTGGATIPDAYQYAQNRMRREAPNQPALWAAFVLLR
ncbi:MAG: CHAT domain-containing tetratricopeptide repeat protein [Saprospiraceae bacterium]